MSGAVDVRDVRGLGCGGIGDFSVESTRRCISSRFTLFTCTCKLILRSSRGLSTAVWDDVASNTGQLSKANYSLYTFKRR